MIVKLSALVIGIIMILYSLFVIKDNQIPLSDLLELPINLLVILVFGIFLTLISLTSVRSRF